MYPFHQSPHSAAKEEQAAGRKGKGKEPLDERVNSRLLCLHNNRSLKAKGAMVTAVGPETWALICTLYPQAIALQTDLEVRTLARMRGRLGCARPLSHFSICDPDKTSSCSDLQPPPPQQSCHLCESLRPLLKRVEEGQPFPELKKLLEAAKGPKASLTFALVGRAWLQLWRDLHAADKPTPKQALGAPSNSLLLLSCPHAAAQRKSEGRDEGGDGGEEEEEEGRAGRLNLPLYLHDLLKRGVLGAAALKEVSE